VKVPSVQFADASGVSIAWQQFGAGPDLLIIPPMLSNVDVIWEHEYYRRVLEFLGRHCRVTHFDKRGIGVSDRIDGVPSLDDRVDDILAVMDAAGLQRANVMGASEGGLMAQLLATRHPERVDHLVLANSAVGPNLVATRAAAGDPTAQAVLADEANDGRLAAFIDIYQHWGRDATPMIGFVSPSHLGNEAFVRWSERLQRLSATQDEYGRQMKSLALITTDPVLEEIVAPTLVANCSRDRVIDPRLGDLLAVGIAGSTRVLFDNDDHFFILNDDWLRAVAAVVEFVTGSTVTVPSERVVSTIVFTDIVGSTAMSVQAGDERWRRLLDEHDRLAWASADRHDGVIVKSTGDGVLARFTAPSAALDFATEFRQATERIGVGIRVGVHTGEVEIRSDQDVTGAAVNLAARVEQAATDREIFVSSTVRDMSLGGTRQFEDRGDHVLKGFDGSWRLYSVAG
jgi:class 3 adenylate cyclase